MNPVSIDIGCGPSKHAKALYGVDRLALPGVNFVCDLEQDPLPFADNSVDVIYTSHTLEHIGNIDHLLREIVRVAKPGATLNVVVPHFSNPLGFSDPTHRRFFGYFSFDYYSRHKDPHWVVPTYTNDIWFVIQNKSFCFKNLSVLRFVFEWAFNRKGFLPYFYESKLSWVVPCFELRFTMTVDK